MTEEISDQSKRPLRAWLPRVLLTFLVFLTIAFVIYMLTIGMGERELSTNNTWALIVAMGFLVLLPVIDRIQAISLSPTGFEAKLSETKAVALAEVGQIENQEVAQAAREQIADAQSPAQVQAAMAMAIELNVSGVLETIKKAIAEKRKLYVRYRADAEAPVEAYLVAPLDIKPGKTAKTRTYDYLWAHSYERDSIVSLRLGRVLRVEPSEETFDPDELMVDWQNKERMWNIPRDW